MGEDVHGQIIKKDGSITRLKMIINIKEAIILRNPYNKNMDAENRYLNLLKRSKFKKLDSYKYSGEQFSITS